MSKESNKRKKDDRRAEEVGPPLGWRERRRTVERRQPEVQEIPFSEWLAHLPVQTSEDEK